LKRRKSRKRKTEKKVSGKKTMMMTKMDRGIRKTRMKKNLKRAVFNLSERPRC